MELAGPGGGGGGGGGRGRGDWLVSGRRVPNMRPEVGHNGKLHTWRTSSVDYCPGMTSHSSPQTVEVVLSVSVSSELNGVSRRCQSLRLGPRDISMNNNSDSLKLTGDLPDQETKLLMETQVTNNKVHFHTEKDDVSLYGTPKEEVGTVNTSR